MALASLLRLPGASAPPLIASISALALVSACCCRLLDQFLGRQLGLADANADLDADADATDDGRTADPRTMSTAALEREIAAFEREAAAMGLTLQAGRRGAAVAARASAKRTAAEAAARFERGEDDGDDEDFGGGGGRGDGDGIGRGAAHRGPETTQGPRPSRRGAVHGGASSGAGAVPAADMAEEAAEALAHAEELRARYEASAFAQPYLRHKLAAQAAQAAKTA